MTQIRLGSQDVKTILQKHTAQLKNLLKSRLKFTLRKIINANYSLLLERIIKARKKIKNKIGRDSLKEMLRFRQQLWEIFPKMLHGLTSKITMYSKKKSESNFILNAIRSYNFVAGSFFLEETLFQRLSPNLKTLQSLEASLDNSKVGLVFKMCLFLLLASYVKVFERGITQREIDIIEYLLLEQFIAEIVDIICIKKLDEVFRQLEIKKQNLEQRPLSLNREKEILQETILDNLTELSAQIPNL